MKIGHAQFGRASFPGRVKGFRAVALVVMALFMALMLASCGPGGSAESTSTSSGGSSSGGTTTTTNTTFTGTVYDNVGNALASKTGVVFLFSAAQKLSTDENGQFSLDGVTGNHTILYSDPTSGFSDYLRWVSLVSGTTAYNYFPLQSFSGTSKTIPALAGDFLVSNELSDASGNGYTATLLVPAQISGKFNYNGQLVSSLPISLENIDLNKTLPFPLPESKNRTAGLNSTTERQAPVVVVNVGPALLRDLEPNTSQPGGAQTVLTLPDPFGTPALKVLHYNAEAHEWQTVSNPANGNQPYTLAEAKNGMRIKEGGFYGVFAEDRSHLGNASGSITKPAGSIVFLGDKFQVLGSDGRVNFTDIHVPYNGRALTVTIIDPSASPAVSSTSVFMVDGSNNEIPDVGDEVAAVTLSALPEAEVTADGTSTITIQAQVTTSSGSAARNGIIVNFSLSPANLADLSASTAQTSGGTGKATVTLTSRTTVSSDLKVSASAQGISASDLSVSLVPGTPATVLLTQTKNSLETNGTDATVITARVRDAWGHPVASGTSVNFTAYKPDGTEYSEIDPKTIAIDGDKAEATLTASSTASAGVYTVTAVSGSASKSTLITFTAAPVGNVALSIKDASIVADGAHYASVVATVTNESGLAMPSGTPVVFTTTAGTFQYTAGGGGTTQYIGAVSGDSGKATVKLYSGTTVAVADVIAESGGQSGTASINFVAGAAASVHLSADPTTLLADGTSSSTLQAVVLDSFGNIVKDGTIVNISYSPLVGTLSALQMTTSGGLVSFKYTAPSTAPVGNAVTINAQVGAVVGSTTITLTSQEDVVGSITVVSDAAAKTADGASYATLTATVKNVKNQPMKDGTVVAFTTSLGTLGATAAGGGTVRLEVAISGGAGQAKVKLYSPTVTGVAQIAADSGDLEATTSVTFIPGAASQITVTADPALLEADNVSESTIEATVKDAFGNLVADGTKINFAIPAGSGVLSGNSALTVGGMASIIYIAPTSVPAVNPVVITVTSGTATAGTAAINLVASTIPVGEVSISTGGSTELVANGSSYLTLSATVINEEGQPAPNGTQVVFTTTAGTIGYTAGGGGTSTLVTQVSGGAGKAYAKLYSGTRTATATITASAGGRNASTSVDFIAGEPANVQVTASPASLTADGSGTSTISAVVTDTYGNPVADGNIVLFSLPAGAGHLSSLSQNTADGSASVTYTAPSSVPAVNPVIISVKVGNAAVSTVSINLSGPVIGTISLTANPASLPADGNSTGSITATVTLAGGGSAPDGLIVNFSVVDGGGSITPSVTTAGGVAIATLTAGSSPGTATIRAEVGGRRADIQVPYQPGNVAITIVPSSVLGTGRETAQVKAVVTQADGSAVTGTAISFSLSDEEMGDLSPYTANTDSKGYTEVTLKTGTKGGTLTVTGTWMRGSTEVKGSGTITIQNPPAVIDVASVSQSAISQRGQGGNTTSVITFNVRDSQNQSVADGYRVNFSIQTGPNGGETLTPLYAYTQNGQVSTTLRSGFKSGPLTIKATYNNDTNVTSTTSWISISNGPPVGEAFSLTSQYLNVSGLNPVTPNLAGTVSVTVGDVVGDAVPDSTSISFKTYNTGGLFPVPASALTVNGSASIDYTRTPVPVPISGFSSLTAEVNNGGRTTHVTSISVVPDGSYNIVYLGTNGGGVYKSTDGGASWVTVSRSSSLMGQNWINPYINDVAVDPNDLNTVWAATGYGGSGALYRSNNGGSTWDSGKVSEVSGVFATSPAVAISKVLCDNDAATNYLWLGTSGQGVYFTDDRTLEATAASGGLTFTQATGLGSGFIVSDIVRSPATHGSSARLYAGTPDGVYQSTNGGKTWARFNNTRFSGDNITSLAIYNNGAADVLYAGTADNGVWVWNAADGWVKFVDGLGTGLRASKPVMASGGVGNGTIDNLVVTDADTQTETWTLTCIATSPTIKFSVAGSVSGLQAAQATAGSAYSSDLGQVSFTIVQGETAFALGDVFTFDTIRDPALSVQDVMVDMVNRKLYVITKFDGALEPHATGNIWVHDLEATGYVYDGAPATAGFSVLWREANTGLPEYDAPDDTTLFPMHVLAMDNPASPAKLFVGGEGIHLYKAARFIGTTDLGTGALDWYASESGLTNLLMARAIVLTSGVCEIRGLTQTLKAQSDGSYLWYYEWYVEDENGNPPISGSTMTVNYYKSDGTLVDSVLLEKYGDVLFNRGTSRSGTPFRATFAFGNGTYDYAELVFEPSCDSMASPPGCSGASITYGLPFSTGDVYLETSASSIQANGSSTSTLTATVRNVDGSLVSDGTPVRFFASLGTLSADTAFTVNGVASVTLTSGTVSGTASVWAVSGQTSSDIFAVVFTPGATSVMSMKASPGSMSADGYSSSTITATAWDANGNLVADNTAITFTIKDPSNLDYGDPTVALTASGSARFTFTATQQDGTYTITAKSPNGVTKTTQVVLTAEQAAILTFESASGVTSPSVIADGSSFVTLIAKVYNTAGLAVKDGTVVNFGTTGGSLGSAGSVSSLNVSTVGGEARVSLYAPKYTGTGTVTASVMGLNSSIKVSFIPGPVAQIRLSATPASLEANGSNTSEINVTVLDANGNPVADDSTVITFSLPANQGRLSALTMVPSGGMGSVRYTTPSSVPNEKAATITATATNGVSNNVLIALNGPIIGAITLTSDPTTLPRDGVSKATIFATVTLQGGGAAPDGTQVVFSIVSGGGTLSAYTRTTAGGMAMTTLTSSLNYDSVTIKGECAGRTHELTVDFTPGNVALTIVPNTLKGTGEETASVRVTVTDAAGDAAAYTDVSFSLSDESMGTITPRTAKTNGVGYTAVVFKAGTIGGDVVVTASWTTPGGEKVSGAATITIQPPPASIQISDLSPDANPNPASISIKGTGGQSTSLLVFDVKDSQNEYVADGYRINFSLETGPDGGESIVPLYAYTKDGRVSTILKSGLKSGTVTIRATYANDTNVTTAANQVAIDNGPPVGEEFGMFAGSEDGSGYYNISGLKIAGLENHVSAVAADIYGQAIPDNTAISFKTYNTGGFFPVPSSSPTSNGVAKSILRSGGGLVPRQGFLSATMEANNGGRTTQVTSIAIVPANWNKNIMYVGTNGGGVYKSTDSGASWATVSRSSTIIGQNWIDPYVNDVAVDPDDPNIVFAATGYAGKGGLYRSFNGGLSWDSDNVEEVFGMLSLTSQISTILVDEGSGYMWVGTAGGGVYYYTDCTQTSSADPGWRVLTADSGLVAGKYVRDIVKSKDGSSGATATLYAATLSRVWVSVNGGADWTALGSNFAGSSIKTLEVTHDAALGDIVWAGTDDAGVWVWTLGTDWVQYNDGLGSGVRATTPVLSSSSIGNGTISGGVYVGTNTVNETWTLTCTTAVANGGIFSLRGTVSGLQATLVNVGSLYHSDTGDISFTIIDGEKDFAVGDSFTFRTVRDPGNEVVDIQLDDVNHFAYAISYFWGSAEPHAVGSVYMRPMTVDGLPDATTPWTPVVDGLPQYDPPDDTSLFAQRVLALDDALAPGAIFAGGEGIHMYKATEDGVETRLDQGMLSWQVSESGLTNLIMARSPMLFTGDASLIMANVAVAGHTSYTNVTYTWYVEDANGNPPISGSTLEINRYKLKDGKYELIDTIPFKTWGDEMRSAGTWYDKYDSTTNMPFTWSAKFELYVLDKVEFVFTPYCDTAVPGCSGGSQMEVSEIGNYWQ